MSARTACFCTVQCINQCLLFVQAQSAEKCAAQLKLARAAAAEAKAAADAALSAAADASKAVSDAQPSSNTAACAAAQAAAQAAADRAAQSGGPLGLSMPWSLSPPTLLQHLGRLGCLVVFGF